MRSYDPADKFDVEERERLSPPQWMIDKLALNPSYVGWGPREDCMAGARGHQESLTIEAWADFQWTLDDWTEVVHFYFAIDRDAEECATCGGGGYHPDARWVAESFYGHSTPFRGRTPDEIRGRLIGDAIGLQRPSEVPLPPLEEVRERSGALFGEFADAMLAGDGAWHDKATQDEVDDLVAKGRLRGWRHGEWHTVPRLAADVNARQRDVGLGCHDGINRMILIESRLKRFGMPQKCPTCDGHGSVWTSPDCRLELALWALHPRKGAARGVLIRNVAESDLPSVYTFLSAAAARNAERFARVVEVAQ